jgi:UDP-N-acetylglucosamine acyltransferase
MPLLTVHPSAIVGNLSRIHETAEIGPYAVIGENVTIGAGTKVGAHAIIDGHTTIGENCRIFAGASIGLEPQDLRYKNEPTGVVLGNNVTIREYVTIHRANGEGFTLVGDDCFLMNYVHIAHNCKLGKGVIMANNTQLAGHVVVEDFSVFSGFCIVHQNVRIGRFVMMGGMTGARVDLPPFTICDGRPAAVRGINVVGLRRGKMSAEVRNAIKSAYKFVYKEGLNLTSAIAKIEAELPPFDELKEITEFLRTSKRGFVGAFGHTTGGRHEASAFEEAPIDEL